MSTPAKAPGFFSFILALVLPPLSFFCQGKIIAGIVSSAMLFVAILLIWLPFMAIIIWFLMAGWAMFSLKKKTQAVQIQNQANTIAEAMVKAQQTVRKEESA